MENQLLNGFFLGLMYVAEEQRLEWLGNRLEQQGSKGWNGMMVLEEDGSIVYRDPSHLSHVSRTFDRCYYVNTTCHVQCGTKG